MWGNVAIALSGVWVVLWIAEIGVKVAQLEKRTFKKVVQCLKL